MPATTTSRRLFAIAPLALAFHALFSSTSIAAFATKPPPIRFAVDKSSIDFGTVAVHETGRDTFRVTNNSECPLRIRHAVHGSGDFTSVCFGLNNLGEIAPGADAGCRAEFFPRTPGPQAATINITLAYGVSCASELHRELAAELTAEREPLVDERSALRDAGPDTKPADAALVKENTRITAAITKRREERRALTVDSPQIVKLDAERRELVAKIHERIGKLDDQWNRLKKKGPNLDVVERLRQLKKSRFALEDGRLATQASVQLQLRNALIGQKRQALEDLRRDGVCLGCSDTKSEYHRKGRHKEESWDAHVKKFGSRPPAQAELDAKRAEYDAKIAAVVRALKRLDEQRIALKAKLDRELAELDDKARLLESQHQDRLDAIQKRISEVRADMSAKIVAKERVIAALRDKAEERRATLLDEIKALEVARKDATRAHERAVATAKKKHRDALTRLDSKLVALTRRHDVAQRKLERDLRATRTTHTDLRGEGGSP